ncbi:MAG: Asp23/Gls24 family envelope stress response protein [Clostridia bacterium]|nr:Asp23/Gls24 family envelope stress response protein [Clostridia bacterium]
MEPQEKYYNIITSLINSAVMHTEGVYADEVFASKRKKFLSSNNASVYFNGDEITIDVYIDVVFGYNVPTVSCALQEKIINDVTENTGLTVKNVNVVVNNVRFN